MTTIDPVVGLQHCDNILKLRYFKCPRFFCVFKFALSHTHASTVRLQRMLRGCTPNISTCFCAIVRDDILRQPITAAGVRSASQANTPRVSARPVENKRGSQGSIRDATCYLYVIYIICINQRTISVRI